MNYVPRQERPLPSVDIVIAGKNEARHLGSCLDALAAQEYPQKLLQIYVVDNGSSDATVEIADEYSAKRHNIHVLRQAKPGAAAARNHGIAQGQGSLVGFLDAHSIPNAGWVRLQAEHFLEARVGGCQGSLVNRADDARVQKYLDESGAFSNAHVIEDTISGKRNLYPWMTTGNCMYRREALVSARGFNENLLACEDVDLAWRIVLLGYLLAYEPAAQVIHYDGNPWHRFVRKGLSYGRSAAELAHIYKAHGANSKFQPEEIWSTNPTRLLSGLCYWAGYRSKDFRIRLGINAAPPSHDDQPIREQFRPRFSWSPGVELQISNRTVFWFRDDEETSVIVHIPTKLRVVLRSTGNLIWRYITREATRDEIVHALVDIYGISRITAECDLDEFVEELIHAGVLIHHMTRPGLQ